MAKRKNPKVILTDDAPAPDFGASGKASKRRPSEIVVIGGRQRNSIAADRVEVRRYRCECTLDQLNAWGQITDRQWMAGIKWRFVWLVARRGGVSSMRWDGSSSRTAGDGSNPLETREQAVRALTETWQMLGPDLGAIMSSVAGEDEYPRRNMERFRDALDRLAGHWRIDPEYCRSIEASRFAQKN